ncbi:PITH domain-containing protein [Dipodascopsis tothii]|uniref:PITH domain-containing protein n=1 Tax=Dipodascopsis tothii TaxID=44089 RepID=UPI0034CFAE74
MSVKQISSQSDYDAVVNASAAVVALKAPWCAPCKEVEPEFTKLAARFSQVTFATLDVDAQASISEPLQVTAVPTFIIFRNGHETARVLGANLPRLESQLVALDAPESSGSDAATARSSVAAWPPMYKQYVAPTHAIVNDSIETRSLEALNVLAASGSDALTAVRSVFARLVSPDPTSVASDADSQFLFYVPFMNETKLHSIILQFRGGEVDGTALQRPYKIKVWVNLPSVLSFDDAASMPAVHEEEVPEPDSEGWSHVKLRYVRFQRVSSVVIFIEGEDDDTPTGLSKVLFIGQSGDKLAMGKLENAHED